ncbi:MAG: hypothetical protein MZV49_10570 [Rhodopseudomonas palustris]|nr:hypothetical protein [Rhodopseudomonas palustris]
MQQYLQWRLRQSRNRSPEVKWRHGFELPEIARHHLWRRRVPRQAGRRDDRQQVPDPGASRPAKSCPACRRSTRVSNGTVEMRHTALATTIVGKDPTFALRRAPCRSA